ncbi:MAG: TolC family protein [Bacteroidia bacterium]|nr:TolC family protein [Bacteroidia bacterium]
MKKVVLLCFTMTFCLGPLAYSQVTKVPRLLTLSEVVAIAKQQSPASKLASTNKNLGSWNYKIFKSQYLPWLALNGTLPDFSNSIANVYQPDGTQAFRKRTLSNAGASLDLNQSIGATGTTIGISSQLQRLDIFEEEHVSSYLAQPLVISLSQPILRYNPLRWANKTEPLRFQESQRQYAEDMENVSYMASGLFFNLLIAQTNLEISQKNKMSTDTLYRMSLGRYQLGKIAENELLQLELATMNAQNQISQSELDVQITTQKLVNYLQLPVDESLQLSIPSDLPNIQVEVTKALDEARKNRKNTITYQRQLLEAESEVARAKGNRGFNGTLSASYGFTRTSALFSDVYKNSLPQQTVTLGLNLPILNWGNASAQVYSAKASMELAQITIQQQQQNFEQEVILAATQLNLYRQKALIAQKADTIAQKRYEISSNRYLIGKITILDLNTALNDRIQAKLSYIQALNDFWNAWFNLRRKTLFDFESGEVIKY